MRIIPVSDFDSPELDVFARVTEPQMRERGILLAETASVILRALEAGYEPLSMLVEKERMDAEAAPVLSAIGKHCGKRYVV